MAPLVRDPLNERIPPHPLMTVAEVTMTRVTRTRTPLLPTAFKENSQPNPLPLPIPLLPLAPLHITQQLTSQSKHWSMRLSSSQSERLFEPIHSQRRFPSQCSKRPSKRSRMRSKHKLSSLSVSPVVATIGIRGSKSMLIAPQKGKGQDGSVRRKMAPLSSLLM
jgi:hypothetical protein